MNSAGGTVNKLARVTINLQIGLLEYLLAGDKIYEMIQNEISSLPLVPARCTHAESSAGPAGYW